MKNLIDTIKTIAEVIVGWAMISLLIDSVTGWGDKGQHKKSLIAGLVAIPIIAIIYIIIDKI